jgi:hypothetical protein
MLTCIPVAPDVTNVITVDVVLVVSSFVQVIVSVSLFAGRELIVIWLDGTAVTDAPVHPAIAVWTAQL